MLMEAMRLSLLEAERSNDNNNNAPSSNRPPNSSTPPGHSDVIATVNNIIASNSTRPSADVQQGASGSSGNDDTPRGSGPLASALASPLANASHLIAVGHALPSAQTPPESARSQAQLSTPERPLSTLRPRLSGEIHQRTDSNPPPTTALAAAISANSVGNAFLRGGEESTSATDVNPSSSEAIPVTNRDEGSPVPGGSASASPSSSSGDPMTTAPSSSHEDANIHHATIPEERGKDVIQDVQVENVGRVDEIGR